MLTTARTRTTSSDNNMDERFSPPARAAIFACVVLLVAVDASAQFGVPFARYRTLETPHFILTFEPGLEIYAGRTATQAEDGVRASDARVRHRLQEERSG